MEKNYARVFVPPKIWFGFKNVSSSDSLVVNVASIEHNDNEVRTKKIKDINFDWKNI